jgi:Protein of unknown function (DUF3570)
VAATEDRRIARWQAAVAPLLPTLVPALVATPAVAVDLPENKAEAIYHVYSGGGVRADGPAVFVRKSLADKISVSGQVYVDAVSNASIDVVTTASPFKEKRTAVDLGVDVLARDAVVKFGLATSTEPDYKVRGLSVDVAQEVYGGMTTLSLGFGRSADEVGRKDIGFFDTVKHWQYRAGVTQILSTQWLASLNAEMQSDSGYLGSPYRAALVFGAAVPERNPRTRTSRALRLSSVYDLGQGRSVSGGWRYFWDNWDIKAHTLDAGLARRVGTDWLVDASVRHHRQSAALFYSDNATTETTYVSRNRQLSTFNSTSLGLKATWAARRVPGAYEMKLHGGYEFIRFAYQDFTDLRTGKPYAHNAHILQVYASATF